MTQPAFDFGDEALDDPANPTFTVSELADAVNGVLRRTFSDGIWVRGEIQGFSERGGHAYFTLGDDTPGRQANLRVQFFANARMRLRPLLQKHRLRLADGMKVRIFGHLDFYAPGGSLGLKMSDLDPRFTLGDLAQQRDQVLRRLAADGSLDANGRRRLSPVPLRVGVVSSAGTAAWHDFHDELLRSGYGFQLVLADTRVQGPEAGRRVARAIIAAVVPRHPARPRRHRRDPRRRGPQRAGHVRRRADRPGHRRRAGAGADRSRPRDRPQRRRRGRPHVAEDPDRRAPPTSSGSSPSTSAPSSSATRPCWWPPRAEIDRSGRALLERAHRIARRTHAAVERADERLGTRARRIRAAADRPLAEGDRRLTAAAERLRTRVPQLLAAEDRHLANLEARLRSLDPVNVLARGWSITRTADGRLVRDPAEVVGRRPADRPSSAGGTLHSRVEPDGKDPT